jgi:protein kinase C substrate 80K-H
MKLGRLGTPVMRPALHVWCLLWLCALLTEFVAAGTIQRVIGADPETERRFIAQIASLGGFRCSNDSGTLLPPSFLNDDYCDCPNGADEPGTAACAGLAPLSQKFFCPGEDNDKQTLPLSWVNDGQCDCCDGSDEWLSGVQCENVCDVLRSERLRELELQLARYRQGLEKRAELVEEAARIRQTEGNQLVVTKRQRLAEAERTLAAIEQKRRFFETWLRWFGTSTEALADAGERPPAQQQDAQQQASPSGLAEMVTSEVERELAAVPSERDLTTAPQAKRLWRRWWWSWRRHHFWERFIGASDSSAPIVELDEPVDLESTACMRLMRLQAPIWVVQRFERLWGQHQAPLERIRRSVGRFAAPLLKRSVQHRHIRTCLRLAQEGVARAHREREEAARALEEAQRLEDAYLGPQDVLLGMRDHPCLRKTVGQYDYEVCLLQHVKQYERVSRGSHTGIVLGSFAYAEHVSVNSSGSPDKLALQYLGGDMCWNGPQREATVIVECDPNLSILTVTETERCKYRVTLQGPLGCFEEALAELERQRARLSVQQQPASSS